MNKRESCSCGATSALPWDTHVLILICSNLDGPEKYLQLFALLPSFTLSVKAEG